MGIVARHCSIFISAHAYHTPAIIILKRLQHSRNLSGIAVMESYYEYEYWVYRTLCSEGLLHHLEPLLLIATAPDQT